MLLPCWDAAGLLFAWYLRLTAVQRRSKRRSSPGGGSASFLADPAGHRVPGEPSTRLPGSAPGTRLLRYAAGPAFRGELRRFCVLQQKAVTAPTCFSFHKKSASPLG